MRVLILGASGMLGHKVWQHFAKRFDTYASFRQSSSYYARFGIFDSTRLGHVSAEDFDSVVRAVERVGPDAVINCIGIVKQDAAAKDAIKSIGVNALFPHRLAHLCGASGVRLVHLSTDCVFSGRRGNYAESDEPDATDLYGRTKLLGETDYDNCLTIRTSMIGRELQGAQGLIEWFLREAAAGHRVRGFKRAVFSGLTTTALAQVIADLLVDQPQLSGVWHVAADAINKFDLLSLVKKIYGLDIEIEPDESVFCDRSLDASRFRAATGFTPAAWPEMIEQMRQDETPYEQLRRTDA
ncbi:MAG TPA: SDR family oxidoreductase [Pyrinomonadaceae bacterium]|nr:SDR family oxidoreductase [Pyrinomonadaceae bacterium]